MQIEPRSDGSGARGSDGNYEEASAEMRRLEDEEQIGHGPPSRASDRNGHFEFPRSSAQVFLPARISD